MATKAERFVEKVVEAVFGGGDPIYRLHKIRGLIRDEGYMPKKPAAATKREQERAKALIQFEEAPVRGGEIELPDASPGAAAVEGEDA
jgi:hypothetical protein